MGRWAEYALGDVDSLGHSARIAHLKEAVNPRPCHPAGDWEVWRWVDMEKNNFSAVFFSLP